MFEAFNARSLSPEEVALSFVAPPHFNRLIKRSNSIIVGPRGSGKTTLLKMLQQSALESWRGTEADELVKLIDYTSVFIPTDRRWSVQLSLLGRGKLQEATVERLSSAAFTAHVQKSLTAAMQMRVSVERPVAEREFRRVIISSSQEVDLVRQLSKSWKIKPEIPSLAALRQALSSRLLEIRTFANELADRDVYVQDGVGGFRDYFYIPFLDSSIFAIDLFNEIVGKPDDRWALAFDELELAPEVVHRELVSALRASDERLLFKLALSPAHNQASQLESAFEAAPGHDFESIRLWYDERFEAKEFCTRLWAALVEGRGRPELKPHEVLGSSYFDKDSSPRGNTSYRQNSSQVKLLEYMRDSDVSFRKYLDRNKIDVSNISSLSEKDRASKIRKIIPIIRLRAFYRNNDFAFGFSNSKYRSRKVPTLYAGAESLFAISEGNPRWFIGIVSSMLDHLGDDQEKLSNGVQGREIAKAADRFVALLRTTPVAPGSDVFAKKGLLGIIEIIAKYIHEQHVSDDFQAEPPAVFRVHGDAPASLLSLLKVALNAGAIVYIPDSSDQLVIGDLRDKSFRISYVLAPIYGLPIRLGRPVSLAAILEDSRKSSDRRNLDLFNDES